MVVAVSTDKSKPAWPFHSDSATLGIINLATTALKCASTGSMKDEPRPRRDHVLMVKYMRWKCPVFAGSAGSLTQPPAPPNPQKTIRRGTMCNNNNNQKNSTSRSFLKNMNASQSSATLKWLSWETVGLYHFKRLTSLRRLGEAVTGTRTAPLFCCICPILESPESGNTRSFQS